MLKLVAIATSVERSEKRRSDR